MDFAITGKKIKGTTNPITVTTPLKTTKKTSVKPSVPSMKPKSSVPAKPLPAKSAKVQQKPV
jgi:hypothetical protein